MRAECSCSAMALRTSVASWFHLRPPDGVRVSEHGRREKPHICNVCNKGFSTSSSLNTHRRIHTGEKPHKCPECGKCFTASSNLYYHRMTHTKNKPHKCLWCPRSFPTPGELRAHTAAHGAHATHATHARTAAMVPRLYGRRNNVNM
ncbi:zinc finger protein 239-like [Cydia amplana]|uniref:zinc finger protein 239-like n=1 Tax=Cydia amplana TaxID=1869771 RepID=UPI002FE5C141